MERIYFDKQVFSYLFKGENPTYQMLLNKILENTQNYIFIYSEALLLDLKTSDPIKRNEELNFIEGIVGNNFLCHNTTNKKTITETIRPIDAFNSRSYEFENFSFSKMFEDLDNESLDDNQRKLIQTSKDLLLGLKFNMFDETMLSQIPENLRKLIPFTGNDMSIQDLFDNSIKTNKNLIEDKSLFKELRNDVYKGINNGKFILHDDEIDFNDNFKLSEIKKTFTEYVYDSLKGHKKDVSNYEFHSSAYVNLEILGITKEPSKSIKFRNLQNDSFHSYYGGYSDIVVSNDTNFVKKTKVLYKLLGIQTKVLNIDEFIVWFKSNSNNNCVDFQLFTSYIFNSINDSKITQTSVDELKGSKTKVYDCDYHFFDYFNTLYLIEVDNQDIYFITKRFNNYSYFTYFQEFEYVVNRAIGLFGIDINGLGNYDNELENIQIDNKSWEGRTWFLNGYCILLQINSGTNEFGLMISEVNNNK